ncbi:MAG: hypothetical protein A3C90_00700 [Candidatus Magasanikbacteria bacterium RIFCSPHIGHO2_02_FULL_51_14]|uniref:Uncharacterized protein n=1 Tax=Candidatus Magasanikbacteria bacterium RIFCSPHIGHO2_02_FULL_51_14 TaxID=1798683 RepID=A0A1F6MF17_9BACT|nr:MAG: hypothetical protein A3C90_00700 [Candidatus Magasanikbacteria bacterium RIFCSPHIGHO2_02_FULL_51_14]
MRYVLSIMYLVSITMFAFACAGATPQTTEPADATDETSPFSVNVLPVNSGEVHYEIRTYTVGELEVYTEYGTPTGEGWQAWSRSYSLYDGTGNEIGHAMDVDGDGHIDFMMSGEDRQRAYCIPRAVHASELPDRLEEMTRRYEAACADENLEPHCPMIELMLSGATEMTHRSHATDCHPGECPPDETARLSYIATAIENAEFMLCVLEAGCDPLTDLPSETPESTVPETEGGAP